MFTKRLLVVSLLLVTAFSSGVSASIINGDYAAGLSNWNTSGNTTAGTLAGSSAALLSTATGANSNIGALDSLLGISSPTGINDITGDNVTEASIIYQSFTVIGTGSISFDWQFLTDDSGIFANQDFGFFVLSGTNFLADVSNTGGAGSNGFSFSTAASTQTISGLAAGTYLIGFGVADVGNTGGDSGLLIDNVVLTDVVIPLPSSVLLLGLGLIGFKRRR